MCGTAWHAQRAVRPLRPAPLLLCLLSLALLHAQLPGAGAQGQAEAAAALVAKQHAQQQQQEQQQQARQKKPLKEHQRLQALPEFMFNMTGWYDTPLEGILPGHLRAKQYQEEMQLNQKHQAEFGERQVQHAAAQEQLRKEYEARWAALVAQQAAELEALSAEHKQRMSTLQVSHQMESLRLMEMVRQEQERTQLPLELAQPSSAKGSGISASGSAGGGGQMQGPQGPVCFVIRTYRGHGSQGVGEEQPGVQQGQGQGASAEERANSDSPGSLEKLLLSLQSSPDTDWVALLVVMDGSPFPELVGPGPGGAGAAGASSLSRLVKGDPRFKIHTYQVGEQYSARASNKITWSQGYHNMLYNATDHAIYACPPTSRWVVITNGDNEYDMPAFFGTLRAVPPGTDMVAFDYYSRYQRITAPPCERFSHQTFGPGGSRITKEEATEGSGSGSTSSTSSTDSNTGSSTSSTSSGGEDPGSSGARHLRQRQRQQRHAVPACKRNLLWFCHTDLAAVAYSWPKFVSEGRTFLSFGLQAEVVATQGLHDAFMVGALMMAPVMWRPYYVTGRCLVSHSPNPQNCAAIGSVWDDSELDGYKASGGRCISQAEAQQLLAEEELEEVQVALTYDPASFRLAETAAAQQRAHRAPGSGQASGLGTGPAGSPDPALMLKCLRRPLSLPYRQRFFPPQCTSAVDFEAVFPFNGRLRRGGGVHGEEDKDEL